MTTRRRGQARVLLAVVAVATSALVAGLFASPAQAATKRIRDDRRDAIPVVDVAWVKIRNAKKRARVTINVPAFEKRRLGGLTVFIGRKVKGRPEYAVSHVRRGKRWRTTWQRLDDSRRACPGLRVSFRKRGVIVSVPQRCLDDNRSALRVQVGIFNRAYLRGNVPPEVIIDPRPGPTLPIDGVPSVAGTKMTRWVAYR